MSTQETLAALERQIWAYCLSIENDPEGRLKSRIAFYQKYGGGVPGQYGYGDSEIAFLEWELRGRLRVPGGSPWWSAVNLRFIYYAELGARAVTDGIPIEELPYPSAMWARYVQTPSAEGWYRAHNSSIVAGYEEYKSLGLNEPSSEQSFVNMVLYRLLYAQSMVEGWSVAGTIGSFLANPDGDAVGLITHISNFYPPDYPITDAEYREMFDRFHNVEEFAADFFDDVVIGTEFAELYNRASKELHAPYLATYLTENKPSYPTGKPVYLGIVPPILRWLRRIWRWIFGPHKH